MQIPQNDLSNRQILVVEDEYFIANDMAQALEERGARVMGPVGSVAEALDLIETADLIDGAVVDINLHGELAFSVAHALRRRQVPFVFATGYDAQTIPSEFHNVVRCEKPVDMLKAANALFGSQMPSSIVEIG